MKYATGTSNSRSLSGPPPTHSALRIGIIQGGNLIEERKLSDCARVTVGQSPRNLFVVSSRGLPRTFQLFRRQAGRQVLRFAPGMDGRITVGGHLRTLRQACEAGAARRVGDWYELVLEPGARGKLALGEITVLFQQLPKAPSVPQPRLPPSLQGGLGKRMDPVFSMVLSGAVALAAAFLVVVQIVPKPTGAVRSARINTLLDKGARMDQREPSPPTPGDTAHKRPSPHQAGEPSVRSTKTKTTPSHATRPGDLSGEPLARLQKNTPEYRAALASLTDMQDDPGRFTKVVIHGKCTDPKGCKNGITGPDHLRSGAAFGDLDDGAQRSGGIASGRPSGPSTQTHRSGLLSSGGKPVVSGTRTKPGHTVVAQPRRRSRTIKAPRGSHTFRPPTGRPRGGAALSAKVRSRVYSLRYCYNRLLPSHPALKGAVKISFVVLPSGRIQSVNITTGMGSAMKSCVRNTISRWTLGKPKISGPVYYGPFYVRFYPKN
jgi:hypothetical protein